MKILLGDFISYS